MSLRGKVYDMIGESLDNGNHDLLDASKNDTDQDRTQFIIFNNVTVKIDWPSFRAEKNIDNFFPEQLKKYKVNKKEKSGIGSEYKDVKSQ